MHIKTKIMIAVTAAVAVFACVGATLAYAGPPTPNPTPSSSPSASPTEAGPRDQKNKGERRGLWRRALHGEVTLGGEKHRVVTFQRGEVTQVSGTAIAVRSRDGFSATYRIDADVRVRQDREAASISEVKVGMRVRVLADKEDSGLTARRVVLIG